MRFLNVSNGVFNVSYFFVRMFGVMFEWSGIFVIVVVIVLMFVVLRIVLFGVMI